ncbi:MAG: hypothetical protein WCV62_02795 [Candidatus Peribacteraceae bacterium]|jgi:hypothetical protein
MALTLTTLGGSSLRISGAERPVLVFPDSSKIDGKEVLALLANPEEEIREGVISWPGEYNAAGVSMRGIGHGEGQQVSYVVELEGIRFGFLSSPLQDWTDKQLEMVGDIDVLVIPAEAQKVAQKLIDEFDPRILVLIPTNDKEAYAAIAKLVGVKPESTMSEYKMKSTLPAEGREVVVLRK